MICAINFFSKYNMEKNTQCLGVSLYCIYVLCILHIFMYVCQLSSTRNTSYWLLLDTIIRVIFVYLVTAEVFELKSLWYSFQIPVSSIAFI